MYDGPVQQGKGVRAAPPAGGVGGIPPVGRPAVRLVLIQPVEPSHVLRIPHCLKGAHVLPAGKNVCAVQMGVDVHHRPSHELLLIQLQPRQHRPQRPDEVPPYMGHVGDLRDDAYGDQLRLHDLEALLQPGLALPPRGVVVKKDMEGVFLPVLRIDPVGGEAAAQSVGPVVHGYHAPYHILAGHALSLPGDHRRNGAPGRNAHLPLQFHALFTLSCLFYAYSHAFLVFLKCSQQ